MDLIQMLIIVIVIIILLMYIYPYLENSCSECSIYKKQEKFENEENLPQPEYYSAQGEKTSLLDDTATSNMGLNSNICSLACCTNQWPLPFKIPVDKNMCNNSNEYVKSNYFCSNSSQDSGCLCMKKDQGHFLNTRGSNSL